MAADNGQFCMQTLQQERKTFRDSDWTYFGWSGYDTDCFGTCFGWVNYEEWDFGTITIVQIKQTNMNIAK